MLTYFHFFFQLNAQQIYSEFQHEIWNLLNKQDNLNNIPDTQTYRQIRYYSVIGPAALPPEELDRVRFKLTNKYILYNTVLSKSTKISRK